MILDRFAEGMGANRVVIALWFARMADALGNSLILVLLPLFVAQLPTLLLSAIPEPFLRGVLLCLVGAWIVVRLVPETIFRGTPQSHLSHRISAAE